MPQTWCLTTRRRPTSWTTVSEWRSARPCWRGTTTRTRRRRTWSRWCAPSPRERANSPSPIWQVWFRTHSYVGPLVHYLRHTAPSDSVVRQVPKTNDHLSSLAEGTLHLNLKEPDGLQELFVPEKSSPSVSFVVVWCQMKLHWSWLPAIKEAVHAHIGKCSSTTQIQPRFVDNHMQMVQPDTITPFIKGN